MTKEEIFEQIRQKRTFLCVGLDPDLRKMPECVLRSPNPIAEFNRRIIDATAEFCVAYKPNLAFYEQAGECGEAALKATCRYLKENYPYHLLIADAKRGDIGNTSRMYASAAFEELGADAVTVAPYMGKDSVEPFLGWDGKWTVLLALTSNAGSEDFQMLELSNGRRLWEQVLTTSSTWAGADKMMYVVGATKGDKFAQVRKLVPEHFLLVPGVGAQGGSLEEVCRNGMNSRCGLLVNSSRGIIYASAGDDFAEAAAREARKLRDEMDRQLTAHGI